MENPQDKNTQTEKNILNLAPKKRKEICVEEIKKIIDLLGPNNVNRNQLAKKYDFNWRTIDKWYNSLILSIPQEQINLIGSKAEITINKALGRYERIAADPSTSTKEKLTALKYSLDALEIQCRILESYSRKKKIPQEINIKDELGVDRIIQIAQESTEKERVEREEREKEKNDGAIKNI